MRSTTTLIALFSLSSIVAGQGQPSDNNRIVGGCVAEPAKFYPCALEKAKAFNPPRTQDGKPDLQGYWRHTIGSSQFDIEEHPTLNFNWPAGKSLVVDPPDGKIPYQAWAEPIARRDGKNFREYIDPNGRCFLPGVPRDHIISPIAQLLQPVGGDFVVWLTEESHAYRVIATDGRPHVGPKMKLWQGDSVGRWEGNTLVVDVSNVDAKTWFDLAGNFYSDNAHVVERWTLVDNDTMLYEATIEDPKVYTRPWKLAVPHVREKRPGFELLEEACHEGDRDLQHFRNGGLKTYAGVALPH